MAFLARTKIPLIPLVLTTLGVALTAALGDEEEAPPPCTQPATTVIERQVTTRSAIREPSIAADRCGRFAIAFEDVKVFANQADVRFLRYEADCTTQPYSGESDGSRLSKMTTVTDCVTNGKTGNTIVSIAMGSGSSSISPPLFATWTSEFNFSGGPTGTWRLFQGWTFDQPAAPSMVPIPNCTDPFDNRWNSASVDDGVGGVLNTAGWTNLGGLLGKIGSAASTVVRTCGTGGVVCFPAQWEPCIATRADGASVYVWAEPYADTEPGSPFDIFMVQLDSTGAKIPSGSTGIQVNSVDSDPTQISQRSPAVSFIGNDIVVVWKGPDRTLCPLASPIRIYGKRFTWGGSGSQPVEIDAEEFRVDSDNFANIDSLIVARPTVALTTSTQPSDSGKFFVAWNTTPSGASTNVEIHGRYFGANAAAIGGEFRVNQTTQPTESGSGFAKRYLAQSGQHTCIYGSDKQVIVTWTAGISPISGVFYTYLPASIAGTIPAPCLTGDVTGDGLATGPDGSDIQPFIIYFLDGIPTSFSAAEQARIACAMDCDLNGIDDSCDLAPFVWLLLGYPSGGAYAGDCDRNCRPDYADIAGLMFPMTNCNPSPLECPCSEPPSDDRCCFCSLIPVPPSPVYVMPDCNENEIDDATDIAEETSVDCNTDGVPDECQLAFYDCNTNGVLDVCDVDPEDPDGDEVVYEDCNSNGLPDECDLVLVYFPSYDCNTNGIPDECDIAEEFSVDCNTNGIPDECDIEAETSEDADTNGIPDECEGESMMMGGGGGGEESESSPYDNPAWEVFWQWQSDNADALAAMSPWDRFKATIDKLRELGLPTAIPWAKVTETSP